MKEKLIKKIYDSGLYLIFGVQTFIFGIFLYFNPNILDANGPYSLITEVLDEQLVAIVLFAVGLFNILITLLEKKTYKVAGLLSMQFVWSVLFFAFLIKQISGYPNTGWILIIGLILALFNESLRGDLR